jgi:class 3 adenylate cyclase
MLLASVLAVVPAAVVGSRLIDVNTTTVEELERELQLAMLDDVAGTITRELSDAEDALVAIGRILTDGQHGEDQAVSLALARVEGAEPIDHVAVFDASGGLIDVIREDDAPRVAGALPESLRSQAIHSGAAVGDAEVVDGEPRVLVLIPLRAGGMVTGFVAAHVSLEPIQARVERITEARYAAGGGVVYVVDARSRVLAHPDRDLSRRLSATAEQTGLAASSDGMLRRDLVRSAEVLARDGTPLLASSMAVPGRPWWVVAQVPQAEAYASLHEMQVTVIASVAAAIVVALLLGLVVAGRIASPLAELTRFAHALARRRFGERPAVRTRDELSLLAHAMSTAADDLAASEVQLRREAAIRADLGRYLPAELVDRVVSREQDLALGGTRRVVTVLFADVVAFTPLTEKRPPEQVVTILNELFSILTGIVFRHGGMVDKFIGDCVMAVWGAAEAQPDHAARALAAAEDMLSWLETGNRAWQERFDVTIRLAIGVHSGTAVVGNIGSETRMEYTAIGDAVNVAARLESLARPQQVLLSAATRELAGDGFEVRDLGLHRLPGRDGELHLYELEP